MKTLINPRYESMSQALCEIARGNYTPLKTFCNRRNIVELTQIGNTKLVVKKYKPVTPLMGLTYGLFRKSKARRAFDNATFLLDNGFLTAAPVAMFEKKRFGILRDCIFISEFIPLPQLSEPLYSPELDEPKRYWLYHNLSEFTLSLHLKGIVPIDYNASNIMLEEVDRRTYRFWLIDINRMRTGHVPPLREAMRAFFQLGSNVWNYGQLLHPYATARGFDLDDCVYHIIRARRRWMRFHRFKRSLARLFGKKRD